MDALAAAAVAGVGSGIPSTVHAVATGRSVLGAARAAGELVGRPGFGRGLVVHVALSAGWATVLTIALPAGHPTAWGAVAGSAIAALDLGIASRRFPAIAALPLLPQVADHVAFGALVGATLGRRRRRARPSLAS